MMMIPWNRIEQTPHFCTNFGLIFKEKNYTYSFKNDFRKYNFVDFISRANLEKFHQRKSTWMRLSLILDFLIACQSDLEINY